MAAAAVPIIAKFAALFSGGLLGAHKARLQGAVSENDALKQLVPAWMQGIRNIVQAANAGEITASQAADAVTTITQNFQAQLSQYQTGPGQHASACGASAPEGSNPYTSACNKLCTAGCCVYCNVIRQAAERAIAVFRKGAGSFTVPQVYTSKYGLPAASSFTLTYKPSSSTRRGSPGSRFIPLGNGTEFGASGNTPHSSMSAWGLDQSEFLDSSLATAAQHPVLVALAVLVSGASLVYAMRQRR